MSFTNTFEAELIGLDKTNTVNAYYARDLAMGLSNSNNIVSNIKKLGYWNLNANTEEESYIKGKIISWIGSQEYSNIINTNLLNLVSEIKSSPEFALFSDRLNRRLERSNTLMAYIDSTDTYDFYSSLTLEELNSIGY